MEHDSDLLPPTLSALNSPATLPKVQGGLLDAPDAELLAAPEDAAQDDSSGGRIGLRRFSSVTGGVASLVGILVLGGWLFDVDTLKELVPGLVAMNPATACAFIGLGLALLLLHRPQLSGGAQWLAQGCAVASLVVGGVKLLALLGGPDVGVDRWLFSARLVSATGLPNRMAPNTALNFVLLGGALWLLSRAVQPPGATSQPRVWPSQIVATQLLALAATLSSMLALLGYAYGIHSFYGIGHFIPMALHTAMTFLMLAVGVLVARSDQGLIAPLTSYSVGGKLARRLLPAAFLVPILCGGLLLAGERLRGVDSEFGIAIFVVVNMTVFATLIWWTAGLLHRTDRARQRALAQMRATALELELSHESLAKKKGQMEADLDLAREIQQAFLPQQYITVPHAALPADSALRFHHRYEPATTLGGDFSDILLISDTQAGIFICDVMGHGVRSALVTAIVRGLAEETLGLARDPGAFLAAINRSLLTILERTRAPLFASAFYLFADAGAGQMRYASAGHPSPLLAERATGAVRWLLPGDIGCGPALGVFADAVYPTHESSLAPRDLVVLYTDGLVEAAAVGGEEYSEERLQAAIAQRVDLATAPLLDEILAEVRAFAANGQFEDDVCLVGMEVGLETDAAANRP